MTDAQEPRENQEAEGEMNGLSLSSCPPGVLLLLRRAAEDPQFKADLLQQRAGAATEAEVELTPEEESWLNAMPAPQLEALVLAAAGRSRWAVVAAVSGVILLILVGILIWKITQPAQPARQFPLTPIPATQPHSQPMISAQSASPATTASSAPAESAESAAPAANLPSELPAVSPSITVTPMPTGEPHSHPMIPAAPVAATSTSAATSAAPGSAPVVVAPSPPQPQTVLIPPTPAAVATPGEPTPAAALAPALFFIPDLLYATAGPVDLVATSDSIFVGQLLGVPAWTRAGDAWTGEVSFTSQTPLRGPAAGQTVRAPAYVLGDSTDPAAPFAFWRRVNLKAATVWLVFTSGGEISGLCPLTSDRDTIVAQVKRAIQIHALDEVKRWPHLNVEISRVGLKNDFLSAFAIEETARSLAPKAEAADVLSRAALNRANAPEPRRAAFWALGWLAKITPANEEARKTQARALTLLLDDAAGLATAESSIRDAYVDAIGGAVVSVGTFERPKLPDPATLQSSPAVLIKVFRNMAAIYDDQARKLDLQLSAPAPAPAPAAPASSVKPGRIVLTPEQIAALHNDIRLARRRQEICLRLIEALGGEAAPPPVETPASWGPAPVPPPGYGPVWPYGYPVPFGRGHEDHHDWPPSSAWPPHSGLPPHH